jgi:hypothetical protein
MKFVTLFVSVCVLISCNAFTELSQNTIDLVEPVEIDGNYSSSDESHYIVRNSKIHLNKLLLFLGGSYSVPKDYKTFVNHAASIGFDTVSLSYSNKVATAPLGSSSDKFIFDNYRDEISFGNPVSDVVLVDKLNSINTRTIKLLQYLKTKYSNQNWDQYLTDQNTLKWDKIVVVGHSQGSGHACYLGKKNLVDRVIMFSGPNDYSSYYSAAANWLSLAGKTPLNKQYSLLHIRDEIVPYVNQVTNLRSLGLLGATENPILADDLSSPYDNRHVFYINTSAVSFHSSTIGGNPILPNLWTYLLTSQ